MKTTAHPQITSVHQNNIFSFLWTLNSSTTNFLLSRKNNWSRALKIETFYQPAKVIGKQPQAWMTALLVVCKSAERNNNWKKSTFLQQHQSISSFIQMYQESRDSSQFMAKWSVRSNIKLNTKENLLLRQRQRDLTMLRWALGKWW